MSKVQITKIATADGGEKTIYTRQNNDVPTQADKTISVQEAAKNIDMGQAISIDLPSRFKFYSFKDLYIKPMRNFHRAKLAAAYQQQSLRPVAEVIDSLLATSSGQTGLVYLLTVEDFTYLMYWIRLHFFTASPITLRAQCKDEKHLRDVKDGKKTKKSLQIVQVINNLVPEAVFLEEDFEPHLEQFMPSFDGVENVPEGAYVSPATYGDIIELTEDDHFLSEEIDPQTGEKVKMPNTAYVYLANAAAFLRVPGMSFRDRVMLVGNMDDADYNKLMSVAKAIPTYGVNEVVKIRCKECGAIRSVKTRLDAHSFFPDL